MIKYRTLMIIGALSLGACESAKQQLGLEATPPDEFAVVKRAPLEFPPDYALRPPRPGAQRPQELKTDEEAKQTVFGADAPKAVQERTVTGGEAILLKKTNAANIDPNIRSKVDAETAAIVEDGNPGIGAVRKLLGQSTGDEAQVVDPKAETMRLKKNKAEGKPVTDGETPTKEQ